MGNDKATREHQKDQNELGSVDDINDLAPTHEGSQARVSHEQHRLHDADTTGYFEGEAIGLGAFNARSLHLSRGTLKDGGTELIEYQAAYNMYMSPLRSTVRAMGRVKDLTEAGAPVSPKQLDSGTKSRFRDLKNDSSVGANVASNAFATWESSQTALQTSIESYGAGQMVLHGAVQQWQAILNKLQAREVAAKRADASADLKEINEVTETLTEIVKTSIEAWSAASEVGESMESATAAIDKDAEAVEEATSVATVGNHIASRGVAARDYVASLKGPAKRAAEIIKAGKGNAKLGLTLEDVFLVLDGDATKAKRLKMNIAHADAMLVKLGYSEEQNMVNAARSTLDGQVMELNVRSRNVARARTQAREGAAAFNKSLGGESANGEMAMYMASAAQELIGFAHMADQQRRDQVDPLWHDLDAYWNDEHVRMAANGYGADMQAIQNNIVSIAQQKQFFAAHLPEWEANANAWRAMLKGETGRDLVTSGDK